MGTTTVLSDPTVIVLCSPSQILLTEAEYGRKFSVFMWLRQGMLVSCRGVSFGGIHIPDVPSHDWAEDLL